MASWKDVERIGLALPETALGTSWSRPAVQVKDAWFALDRGRRPDAVDDAGERIEGLIVLYVEDEETKLQMAQDDSGYFLTTDHFANSRMILVHLDRIPADELEELLIESWLIRAPKRLAATYLRTRALDEK